MVVKLNLSRLKSDFELFNPPVVAAGSGVNLLSRVRYFSVQRQMYARLCVRIIRMVIIPVGRIFYNNRICCRIDINMLVVNPDSHYFIFVAVNQPPLVTVAKTRIG